MVRPRIYSSSDDESYDVNRAKTKRYYERNIEVQRIKGRIKYYNKCLKNNDLTQEQRKKYEYKLFEAQQQLQSNN